MTRPTHPPPPPKTALPYPLERRLGGRQSRSRRYGAPAVIPAPTLYDHHNNI
jgi:hypothetical protein